MLVSIITVCFNSEKTIRRTLESVLEQTYLNVEDLIDGRLVCGAGGGGFLQVILKKGVTKEAVHTRLKEVFQDNPVGVWPAQIQW